MRVHKLSITTPDLLTWEESEREGVSEPISVRTVMSIINCRGDSSDSASDILFTFIILCAIK